MTSSIANSPSHPPLHTHPPAYPTSSNRNSSEFLDYNKSLACIHCGLCLSSCPTYLETGNENDSPRGRIYLMRALHDGRTPLNDVTARHLDLCLGCRACEATCPSGVQYGELLEQTRDHIEHHLERPLFQRVLRRLAIEKIFPFPNRLRLAIAPVRWLRALRLDRLLPAFLRDAMDLIPTHIPHESIPYLSNSTAPETKGTAGLVTGCAMSVLFPQTNARTAHLLNQSGWNVARPSQQVCCGALYAHSGQLDAARDCARKNIAAFEAHSPDIIVINAAGCGSTLKEYGHLLAEDPDWSERAQKFSAKVKDLSEALPVNPPPSPAPALPASPPSVTYHDACHLAHAQRITSAPRQLLRTAPGGAPLVDLPESDVCCGSAGTYNLTEPEMAAQLQARKIENIRRSGAQIVVTTNPGCLLQIQSGLKKAGLHHIRALHLADYLFECSKKTSAQNTPQPPHP